MPTKTEDPKRVKVMLTLTVEESAKVDAARGSIPAATWCKEAVLRALASR